ncbi:MAG: efflux RND transporter periplasmic adaptor subunit [Gemmatimonadaceae bacterium]
MKRLAWIVVVIGVLAVAGFALARANSAPSDSTLGSATSIRVARRDIGTVVKATGVIKPRVGAEVRVGSRISGVVRRLHVQIGDSVAKGQLLAELDDRDFLSRRDEAAATLRELEANVKYARKDLERKRALNEANGVTQSELEVVERAYDIGESQVAGARANLAFATTQLEYTRIVAPIAGVVASVSTQEGETVAASFAAPTFLTLLDPARLEVWAYVDETDIGRIRTGQTARFTVDTYSDHEFDGRVSAVHPTAEIRDNVVNYVTVIRFQPPRDRILRPEMTTTVRVALETKEHVLAVPIRAVRWENGRAFVLSRRAGVIERRWVTVGKKDDSYSEILDGLLEGDEILIGEVDTQKGDNK